MSSLVSSDFTFSDIEAILRQCDLRHWLVKCKGADMLKIENKLVLEDRLRQLGFDTTQLLPLQANINGQLRQLVHLSDPARDADGQVHFSVAWQNGSGYPERVFWHELTKSTQSRVSVLAT